MLKTKTRDRMGVFGMEKKQELEWDEAQKIAIREDLVAAAKQQLKFLAAVDRNRGLHDGPALDRAIYRYKYCWLPLLAKHAESEVSEGPLVAPLDCEWIWHCHRLNPVQYKADCESLYGKILDTRNVVSSIKGTSKKQTEAIWNRLYPNEAYELDLSNNISKDIEGNAFQGLKTTKYDLVSAVKRQSTFFFQVSIPCMNDERFLEGAVARYKGFLHLIKRNRQRGIRRFCVPTYDIDLIWHSHQSHPVSYCNDVVALLGEVLPHDDTDSDRSKGKKLDVGFSGTTKQWEETFGSRYWRAGAMHKGSAPTSLMDINMCPSHCVDMFPSLCADMCPPLLSEKEEVPLTEFWDTIQLPKTMLMEVMVEIVGVKNLPAEHKGKAFVSISKKQPDMLFNTKKRLSILSETREKKVAAFQCEPTGGLLFELVSNSSSNSPMATADEVLGTTLISIQDILTPVSTLSFEKWLELAPGSGVVSFEQPISLRIALSFTAPILAPYVLQMIRTRPVSSNPCSLPLPEKVSLAKSWMRVIDKAGDEVIRIQMRDSKKEVIGTTRSGEIRVLAEFVGTGWSMMGSLWFLQLHKTINKDGQIFELTGTRKVLIFPGKKLDYKTKICEREENEHEFVTIIEFSVEHPYGKAVAVINLRCGLIKVNEEWVLLPGIILALILPDIMRKNGCIIFSSNGENFKVDEALSKDFNKCNAGNKKIKQITGSEREVKVEIEFAERILKQDYKYKGRFGNEFEAVVKSGAGACGVSSSCYGCGGCGARCGNEDIMKDNGACCGCSGCSAYAGCVSFAHGHENIMKNDGSGGCGGCGGCGGGGGGCGGGGGSCGGSGGCGGGCHNK